jgi:hypothetical protein
MLTTDTRVSQMVAEAASLREREFVRFCQTANKFGEESKSKLDFCR